MRPFFSIIIPLFNKEHVVSETIKSALNQTFTDFEIILVNDGSTDHSISKVEAIKDKRIQLYNIENKGVSHARNYGISKAKAEYISFLDADDYWYENHLENLHFLFNKHPKCGLYASAYKKKIGSIFIESVYKNIPKKRIGLGL